MKNTNITIGIPTFEAGSSLAATLRSIYVQSASEHIKEILVVVDGGDISQNVRAKINNPKLKIIPFHKRKGQSARINDIVRICKTPLLVLTNDDVRWKKTTLNNLLRTYKKTKADLISGHVVPTQPLTIIEKMLNVGTQIGYEISRAWNKGDNYLSCNGRLLLLSKKIMTVLRIPQSLWNNDAYIYFKAKFTHRKTAHSVEACCYFRNPSNWIEYLKQSRRFKLSRNENQKYFNKNLRTYYSIPRDITLKAALNQFIKNPFFVIAYLFVHYLISIFGMIYYKKDSKYYWQTDITTKKSFVYFI